MLTLTNEEIQNYLTRLYLDHFTRVFWIKFITKDGDIREIEARFGVIKHLKGGSAPYDFFAKGLLPVCDMDLCRRIIKARKAGTQALDKKGKPIKSVYRSVPFARIIEVRTQGEVIVAK